MAEVQQVRVITHEVPPQIGGIGTYVVEISRAFSALGWGVEVWGPRGGELGERLRGVEFHGMPTGPNQGLWNLWRLNRYLRQHHRKLGEGVVWLAEPAPIRALALYGHGWLVAGQQLWVTLHGSEMAQFRGHWFWEGRVRRLLKRADRIALVSEAMVREFLDWCPELEGRVRLTRCALRTDFHPRALERQSFGEGEKVRIFTVARLHPRKGQDLVLRALSSLPVEVRERICYEIVGGGRADYLAKLKAEALGCGVEVEFSGPLHGEELASAYERGDLFVLPSRADPRSVESFGMAYLEASAWGKPVIGTRVGGVAEAVSEGRTGLLVGPDDVEALAGAMLRLLEDPELARAMGEAGPAWAAEFSWEESARELMR